MEEATSLDEYLQELAAEGTRDSTGLFTLSAERVASRYRGLLQEYPALPWLRWLQLACRCGARRSRCQMLRDEYRLMLTACDSGEALIEAVQSYPEPTPGTGGTLHEVLWLFLAQDPERIELTVPGWLLRIEPGRFERLPAPAQPEEDAVLRVVPSEGWFSRLGAGLKRAAIQRGVMERAAYFPGVLEWDGSASLIGLPEPDAGVRRRLVVAQLVPRQRASRIPHFAYHAPAAHQPARLVVSGGNVWELSPHESGCDWFVLRLPQTASLGLHAESWDGLCVAKTEVELRLGGSEDYVLSGDRMRVRWLLMLSEGELVGRFRPFSQGIALDGRDLPDWPPGSIFMAACPPDLKTDYSGLKLVEDDNLRQWLEHGRSLVAAELRQLVHDHPSSARQLVNWLPTLSESGRGPEN